MRPIASVVVEVRLGIDSVDGVHVGTYIELDLAPGTDEAQVQAMCRQLLANPVIEQYRISINEEP